MSIIAKMSNSLHSVYFGKNWTGSDFSTHLTDVTWEQATAQVYDFNTIATLVYHAHYYVTALINVLEGNPLNAKDEYSFHHPVIRNQADWEAMLGEVWAEAEKATLLIAQLPEKTLEEIFADPKYGDYYRNIQGTIEHLHYHLGQIVLIKKIILEDANDK